MDGNGRWARSKGLPRVAGHQRGVETVRGVVQACSQLGVKNLTLYTFSTENWKRPYDEVSTLMRLIVKTLQNETDELHANNIKISTLGDLRHLPKVVQKELEQAINKTINNTAMGLNLAISYSGRWELVEAVKKILSAYKDGDIDINDISEEMISKNLTTREMNDPDLLIRSGGEFRISNFLLWQIAYSLLFVTNILWPEFKPKILLDAIQDYQQRERRFGQVSEQISKNPKIIQNAKKLSKHAADF